MQLFDEGFYTEDFDQEMFDFIKAQGWSLDGETGLVAASLSASHLYYGDGIDGFWTDNDEDFLEDYSKLTKQEFMEKIGMTKNIAFTKADTKSPFTKSDLKDGMIVTTRNGDVYTVTGDRLLRVGAGYIYLEEFDDELICSSGYGNEEFDIISVQQTVTLFKRETEAELKQQRITKELEFAEAKRERLNAHIERLKGNLEG